MGWPGARSRQTARDSQQWQGQKAHQGVVPSRQRLLKPQHLHREAQAHDDDRTPYRGEAQGENCGCAPDGTSVKSQWRGSELISQWNTLVVEESLKSTR